MSIALTFSDKELLASPVMGPRRRLGLVGIINWRDKTFTLNGVERKWDELKSRSDGIFSSEREWNWANRPYKLNRPEGDAEFRKRSGRCALHDVPSALLHESQRAVLYFPHERQDESERMFLLMAILHMDTTREDRNEAAAGG
ncbi:hypothetical protein FB451DRAFT_1454764 [Mycena latifolia]|nr:hypothetical protein FB451DRAFT_1454764 [Mycena latifolia]